MGGSMTVLASWTALAAGEYPPGKITTGVLLFLFFAAVLYYIWQARQGRDLYVRPIAGLAAMNEAVGRATEMGRPILYVPGIADVDDIQTIASIVILAEVAKLAASCDTRTIVPCRTPLVFTLAEETVRNAYASAGRPDAFQRDDVRFISDDQFAYTAGTTGIMLRERPATNLYLGAFWAESLILAETGFAAGAIQIAGTANVSQLPFFVAACDYTLIGEELYAASAYLSREPKLLGSLKASDLAKVVLRRPHPPGGDRRQLAALLVPVLVHGPPDWSRGHAQDLPAPDHRLRRGVHDPLLLLRGGDVREQAGRAGQGLGDHHRRLRGGARDREHPPGLGAQGPSRGGPSVQDRPHRLPGPDRPPRPRLRRPGEDPGHLVRGRRGGEPVLLGVRPHPATAERDHVLAPRLLHHVGRVPGVPDAVAGGGDPPRRGGDRDARARSPPPAPSGWTR